MDDLLTVGAAARALDVSEQWIRRLLDSGKLEGQRTPYGRLITAASVEKMRLERAER